MQVSVPIERARVRVRAGVGRRVAVVPYVRLLLAGLSFGAAAVHFAVAPEHFSVSWVQGTFFGLVAWAQTAFAVAILLRPSRAVLRLGFALNAAVLVVWVVSRTSGVPVGPDAWTAEPVAFADVLTSVLEVATVLGCQYLLRPVRARGRVAFGVVVPVVVAASLAVVGTTTASIASALGGHSHGASVAGHTHPGAVTAAGPGGGSASGLPASGIESATGTSPCERSGASFSEASASGGHGHHGPVAQRGSQRRRDARRCSASSSRSRRDRRCRSPPQPTRSRPATSGSRLTSRASARTT